VCTRTTSQCHLCQPFGCRCSPSRFVHLASDTGVDQGCFDQILIVYISMSGDMSLRGLRGAYIFPFVPCVADVRKQYL
jgi:hypothetical protein